MSDWVEVTKLQNVVLEAELKRRFALRLTYLVLGFAFLVAGFALGLLGYSGSVDFELGLGEVFRARLGNAAPGLVFVVCGLIVACAAAFAFRIDTQVRGRPRTGAQSPGPVGAPGDVIEDYDVMSTFAALRYDKALPATPFTVPDPITLGQVFNIYQNLRASAHKGEEMPPIDWHALQVAIHALTAACDPAARNASTPPVA